MFSSRTPSDLRPNRLALALERKRALGAPVIDLTESNPTRAAFDYPADAILGALAAPAGMRYEPDPRGMASARRAVSRYYAARGAWVDPEHVVLTASTSEAYALLFKLLMGPGDHVLIPEPSYPLFDHLARAESVVPSPYPLAYDGAWRVDMPALWDAAGDRARAIVVVSPNNPTGSCLTERELAGLVVLCAERGLGLICDEVFGDYVAAAVPSRVRTVAGTEGALTFALSGLSKVAALPQLKAGWIAVSGPAPLRDEALARLEFLADLFLSVSTPVQVALPRLLEFAPAVADQVRARISGNRAWLEARLGPDHPVRALPAEGGWYAVLRVPRVLPEEDLVLGLLEDADVLVHPGYFFDFEREGWLVVSLLPPDDAFAEGMARVLAYVDARLGAGG
jgi:aspartate/methionine/tyrosine aminotransferase